MRQVRLDEEGGEAGGRRAAPLAERMRPRDLDEFAGQEHLLGPGRLLRRAIEQDRIPSMILWGPPGTGKTTLALLMARLSGARWERLSAVTAGVADVRRIAEEAGRRRAAGERTVLFIDEIHRFNRAQQDAVLPYVEDGTLVLIGATTENPYFSVNAPLLSRCRLFRLEPLSDEEVRLLLERALTDRERGLGALAVDVEPGALERLAAMAAGDARAALNALELAVENAPLAAGRRRLTAEAAAEAFQRRLLVYDRTGDEHYDTVSAWIKSMRGSDPDAALHYLARMLEAGEDQRFLARRLLIHAAEDVGLADPQALVVAAAAATAVDWVGLPEAALHLAEATLYISLAPKSNSVYAALAAARREARERRPPAVPPHLRDSSYPGARHLGHGRDYKYPHDYPGGWVEQTYLPPGLEGGYYRPGEGGWEAEAARRLERLRAGRGPSRRRDGDT